MNRLSKVEIQNDLKNIILQYTENCGKARLILKNARYYIESSDPSILRDMLNCPDIASARINEVL